MLVAGAAACILIILGFAEWMHYANSPPGAGDSIAVDIKQGMAASDIARELAHSGIIRSELYFRLETRRGGYAHRFKAGRHIIDGGMTTRDIVLLLTKNPPEPPDKKVTVIEGLTIQETASVLAAQAGIDSVSFVGFCGNRQFLSKLGVDKNSLEGYLYPDTYFVRADTRADEMIRRMVRRFHDVFNDTLAARAAEIGMTVHGVVTLASIIETEATLAEERPLISQVFHRRLHLGRPLEANPTIQYAIGSKRRVLHEDLEIDSPYNTYTHRGLPPGPIASPGKDSILAALYPADTNYLYFMANGKGGHVFSKSLQEHNRAVREYKRLRRQRSN